MTKRILVAEDERRIAGYVENGLRRHGFDATSVPDGRTAYRHAVCGEYDLLILDVGLPSVDGFTVLRWLRRAHCSIPVIILTARDDVEDTVAGLDGGADDYMSKPFHVDELAARVRRRLRSDDDAHVLRHGHFALNRYSHRVEIEDRTVDLTEREFTLVETFFHNPGQVLSREHLLATVWGEDVPTSNVLEAYVRNLRRKLGAGAIVTVRGKGYRLGQGSEAE